ncbi:MAG: mandelate racemase/muconate lactonizing enzyme family protein [Acidimicrobiia bacterium]|nr:mandelate racemase/muconate lactonizing enzyme family protein [Acidimicrobiia bacterium]
MKIVEVRAHPTSFPLPEDGTVRLGIGRAVKKDAVLVEVRTEDGVVGWGEAHHGRAPGTVAHLVDTTLRQLVVGMEADDTVGVWARVARMQLDSHGLGAAAAIALSGLDMALWDARGKACGWPLWKLLGGSGERRVPAYAGGVSLGFQPPAELVGEAAPLVEAGYRAVKLRLGDNPADDVARVAAVREAFGDELVVLTDANTGYSLADARRVMPALAALGVGWLEEPFPSHAHADYARAAAFAPVPLACGENHYTRYEFARLLEDGVVQVLQPDLSKAGGVTEVLRIAAMASAQRLAVNPHTSMTGLNMAATIHLLASVDNAGYFEGDCSLGNRFRDDLVSPAPYTVDGSGCVRPLDGPGIGVEVDESFLRAHPLIDGPSYV